MEAAPEASAGSGSEEGGSEAAAAAEVADLAAAGGAGVTGLAAAGEAVVVARGSAEAAEVAVEAGKSPNLSCEITTLESCKLTKNSGLNVNHIIANK